MAEPMNEVIDVQVFFKGGRARPARFAWRNREVRLNAPSKIQKALGSNIWEYWCAGEDGANMYRLRWDVTKMDWRLVEVLDM